MAIFGGSSSRSRSSNAASETAQQVQEQGSALSFSNIQTGKYGNVEIDATTTDFASVEKAMALANETLKLVDKTNKSAFDSVDQSFSFAGGAFNRSIDAINDTNDQAFNFAGGAFNRSIDAINDTNTSAFSFVSEAANSLLDTSAETIATVAANTRSDASESFNQLVKYSGIGVVSIAAIFLIMFFIGKK
jgi:hypothetical protein